MNSYRIIAVIIGAVIYFCNAESNDTLDELDIEERDVFLGKSLNKLPTGMPGWARRFTRSKTGCPCWWDLTLGTVCACCKNFRRLQGQPCGYPLHNYCQQKRNAGCPGIPLVYKPKFNSINAYNKIVIRRQLAIFFETFFRIVAKRKQKDSSNGLRAIHIVNQRISLPL